MKYRKQQLMTRYGQQTVKSSPDPSYGSNSAKPDVPVDELKQLHIPGVFETPAGSKIALLKIRRSRNKFLVEG